MVVPFKHRAHYASLGSRPSPFTVYVRILIVCKRGRSGTEARIIHHAIPIYASHTNVYTHLVISDYTSLV